VVPHETFELERVVEEALLGLAAVAHSRSFGSI
jgi:hypothetical protein